MKKYHFFKVEREKIVTFFMNKRNGGKKVFQFSKFPFAKKENSTKWRKIMKKVLNEVEVTQKEK